MLGETTNAATKDALCFSFEAAPCLLTRSCPIIRMIRQGRGMGQERAAKRLCRRAVKADRKAHQFLGPTGRSMMQLLKLVMYYCLFLSPLSQ